jgi:hypothetical protein
MRMAHERTLKFLSNTFIIASIQTKNSISIIAIGSYRYTPWKKSPALLAMVEIRLALIKRKHMEKIYDSY